MEIANIAFHENTSEPLNVIGKHMRKGNVKGKVDHLFDENKGKRTILGRYLRDAVKHVKYTQINDILCVNEFENHEKTFDSTNQHSVKGIRDISKKHVNKRKCLEIRHIQDNGDVLSKRNSSFIPLVSDEMDVDSVRLPGDGSEVPDVVGNNLTRVESGNVKRIFTGIACRENFVLMNERNDIEKELCFSGEAGVLFSKDEKTSTSKFASCNCNALSETRKRLKHKSKSKLQGLLHLYKTMKMRKKFVKKCVAGNLKCFTPVKSRTCLNSAFIMHQTGVDGTISSSGNTRLNFTVPGKTRLSSGFLGRTKDASSSWEESAFISNTSNSAGNVLNAAFISSCLTDSQNTRELTERETFMLEESTVTDISDENKDELKFSIFQAQCMSLHQSTTNCSSSFEEFAYLNNGFVMD